MNNKKPNNQKSSESKKSDMPVVQILMIIIISIVVYGAAAFAALYFFIWWFFLRGFNSNPENNSKFNQTISIPSQPTNQDNPSLPSKMAMTWSIKNTYSSNGKQYTLFGADNLTNAYNGDTKIDEVRSLLCIKKDDLPPPNGIPSSIMSKGGALSGSWSGGKTIALPNIKAYELTSQAIADQKCLQEGQKIGQDGFRMAEFHDGDLNGGDPGWSFWAEDFSGEGLKGSNTRYWVRIKDQPANPWN